MVSSPTSSSTPHGFPFSYNHWNVCGEVGRKEWRLPWNGSGCDTMTPFTFNKTFTAADCYLGNQLKTAGYNYCGNEPMYTLKST